MKRWVHKLVEYTGEEIAEFVFKDKHWCLFQNRIRYIPTELKLDQLEIYRSQFLTHNAQSEQRRMEVQTSTYIHGLMLTGYLTTEFTVVTE